MKTGKKSNEKESRNWIKKNKNKGVWKRKKTNRTTKTKKGRGEKYKENGRWKRIKKKKQEK